jgi:tripartite-type tricarboxylate transporter receptor subunit TctC
MRRFVLMLVVVSFLLFAVSAAADEYPSKNITYQVTFAAGGASDIRARQQQPVLEEELGVKILVQYKPGGGGSIGWANLVRQKPDGYFISGMNIPHIILQPLARKDAGYKTEQILPVILFQEIPFALTVLKDSPFKTLEDLVDYAKKNPGAVTVGGSGSWDATHIAHLQFEKMAGIKMTYIPHKGGRPKQTSLLGGHTMASWFGIIESIAHGDKVRNLAVGTEKPVVWYPDLPTFKSKGYNLMSSVYHGVAVPVGTPEDVVKKLEQVFTKIAKDPKVIERKLNEGYAPIAMSSAESKALIKAKIQEWTPIVKEFVK